MILLVGFLIVCSLSSALTCHDRRFRLIIGVITTHGSHGGLESTALDI